MNPNRSDADHEHCPYVGRASVALFGRLEQRKAGERNQVRVIAWLPGAITAPLCACRYISLPRSRQFEFQSLGRE
jgi:hypothetical protein